MNPDYPATVAIGRAAAAVPRAFCLEQCPLAANARRCPWHNQQFLGFWRLEALHQWTERHCPVRSTLLPLLDTP